MKPALFAIEDYFTPIAGLQTGKRWNGWQVPLFPMASCEAIAAELRREDGRPIFTFNSATNEWVEHPAGEEPYAVRPEFVGGVPHWPMGDGYCWDEVGLEASGWEEFFRDGEEDEHPELWPLPVQAFLLGELWNHGYSAHFHFEGINYSFAR